MSKSINMVLLLGYVGADPDLKYTPQGVAVINFNVATSKKWKDADGNMQERTSWHRVVAWRGLAEIAGQYVKKGSRVHITGELQTRTYDKDGEKRYMTEVVASDLIVLTGMERTDDPPQSEEGGKQRDDDFPF